MCGQLAFMGEPFRCSSGTARMNSSKGMPQRPRSHQLENESRRAFKSSVPLAWVVHDRNEDYGVDLDVEIFDSDGAATGLSFAVQLRATDESDIQRALVVRMRQSTLRYLKQLDVPALLVRYHAPSGHLYIRWIHEFPIDLETSGETISLRLYETDRWSDDTPLTIKNEVSLLRDWKDRDPSLPIEILVRTEGPEPDTPAGSFAIDLRDRLSRVADIVTFTSTAHPDHAVRLTVTQDDLTVDILGRASFRWTHGPVGVTDKDRAESMLVQLALVLDKVGKESLAARLLEYVSENASLLYEPYVGLTVGLILGASGAIDSALQIARAVMAQNGEVGYHAARQVAHGLFLVVGPRLQSNPITSEKLRDLLVDLTRIGEENAISAETQSRTHYSLANLQFNQGEYRQSLRHQRLAAMLDEAYRSMDYWWAETAAALFELGRYKLAYAFYECAQELSDDPERHLVRGADVLLHIGRLGEASRAFDQYLATVTDPELWWILKAGIVHEAIEERRPSDQQRSPEQALALVRAIDTSLDANSILNEAVEALNVDFLCHQAWHNVAAAANQLNDEDEARRAAFMSLVTDPNCLDSYLMVIQATLADGTFALIAPSVIEVGYQLHGDALLSAIYQDIEQVTGQLPPEVTEAFEAIAAAARAKPRLPTISRIW